MPIQVNPGLIVLPISVLLINPAADRHAAIAVYSVLSSVALRNHGRANVDLVKLSTDTGLPERKCRTGLRLLERFELLDRAAGHRITDPVNGVEMILRHLLTSDDETPFELVAESVSNEMRDWREAE